MPSLKTKLKYLDETKSKIREAIEQKGQSINDSDSFRSYVEKILAITDDLESEFDQQDEKLEAQSDIIEETTNLLKDKVAISGLDTSDATATEKDILEGKTAYVNGEKIEGTLEYSEEKILKEEMRTYDLIYTLSEHQNTIFSEKNYTDIEVQKIQDLLNKLGGDN